MTSPVGNGVEIAVGLLREQLPADRVVAGEATAEAVKPWNAQVRQRPAVIARCHTTDDVRTAVLAARSAGLPLSVLGGGHDWGGGAIRDGGLLVDLSAMRRVTVEGAADGALDGAVEGRVVGTADGAEARVAGGATVSDVLDAVRPHGYAAAVGTVSSVGFAGLTLGGGYGTLIGLLGLGVDNLLSAEVVLADGRVVTADPEHEPDLFWALRGGGGNFGVVTELRTRLHPHAEVTTGLIAFSWEQAGSVLRGWRNLTAAADDVDDPAFADDALDVMFGALHTPAGLVLFTSPTWAGDPARADEQIARVRALGEPVLEDVGRRALADAVHAMDELFPQGRSYHLGSRLLPVLTDAAIDEFVRAGDAMPTTCALNVHHAHGAVTRVAVDATAYQYRDEHLVVEILGSWTDGDGDGDGDGGAGAAEAGWVRDTERRLDAYALPGGWPNLMARDDPRAAGAFGGNTERLLAVKAHYDPDGMFTAMPLPR
ncbi:FAD-binding protein [Catenulispora sp. NF23]|uniref:FAD-dependent oxidoreductase n=1 Tax=Catenulispora pinistramenti TaxID=2705254 RepID=UPI001BA618AE|nr:FAD-binding protein [Catenulispora pinistramenti]MBS2537397.1 FAD-binding protein [Catenulispora pinistramenti]